MEPFWSLLFFFKSKIAVCTRERFEGRGAEGEFAAFTVCINHVESKWACAIPARLLAQKDPSSRRNRCDSERSRQKCVDLLLSPQLLCPLGSKNALGSAAQTLLPSALPLSLYEWMGLS